MRLSHEAKDVAPRSEAQRRRTSRTRGRSLRYALALATSCLVTFLPAHRAHGQEEKVKAPLQIILENPSRDHPYRGSKSVYVSGYILAEQGVESLNINGVTRTDFSGAPKEPFSVRLPIGAEDISRLAFEMPIRILARDRSGREAKLEFELTVWPISLNARESKMSVAVLAFHGVGVPQELAAMIRTTLETRIFDLGRFRVLDLTNLEDILAEQERAALKDPNAAIVHGKVARCDFYLDGDLFPRGDKGIELKLRVIDASTDNLVTTLDTFVEDKNDPNAVDLSLKNVVGQLLAFFPRLSGDIIGIREDTILVSWGLEDGARIGQQLLIVEQGESFIDASTGEILEPGENPVIGEGVIEKVGTSSSVARVTETQGGVKIVKGMAAITK